MLKFRLLCSAERGKQEGGIQEEIVRQWKGLTCTGGVPEGELWDKKITRIFQN